MFEYFICLWLFRFVVSIIIKVVKFGWVDLIVEWLIGCCGVGCVGLVSDWSCSWKSVVCCGFVSFRVVYFVYLLFKLVKSGGCCCFYLLFCGDFWWVGNW